MILTAAPTADSAQARSMPPPTQVAGEVEVVANGEAVARVAGAIWSGLARDLGGEVRPPREFRARKRASGGLAPAARARRAQSSYVDTRSTRGGVRHPPSRRHSACGATVVEHRAAPGAPGADGPHPEGQDNPSTSLGGVG